MPTPRHLRLALLPLLFALAVGLPGLAEEKKPPRGGPEEFPGLAYRLIGPPAGGRVSRVAGVPGDPLTYYAATASGGVWKSTDGGIRWKPRLRPAADQLDRLDRGGAPRTRTSSTWARARRTSAATWPRGTASTSPPMPERPGPTSGSSGGRSGRWSSTRRTPTSPSPRCWASPSAPTPSAACTAPPTAGRPGRRCSSRTTTPGPPTWPSTPRTRRIVFAGFWQMRRRPWELVSGGPGSGLAVSRDGGDTWTWLTGDGLPDGIWGKVGVAVAPSDPRRVYALIEAEEGGLFRSDDGGETWTRANDHGALRQRAWYYTTLTVDPTNPDVVWFPQVPLLKTIDGGKTITRVKGPHHGDHHDIWIDPLNPRRILNANDGGVDVSSDGGETWYAAPLPISQFYHVSVDSSVPYRVSGAMQDLGTASGPSNSLSSAGITLGDWHGVGGGEAGYTAHDPSDPNVVYAGRVPRHLHPLRPPHPPGALRGPLARVHLRVGRGAPEVPHPVDRSDHHLAPRPEDRLPRRQRGLPHPATAARPGRRSAPTSPATTRASRGGREGPSPATTPASSTTAPSSRSRSRPSRRGSCGSARTTGWSTSPATTARRGRT